MKPLFRIEENSAKPQTRERFQIAVLAPSTTFPLWQAQCIRNLLNLENVCVTLLVLPGKTQTQRGWQALGDGLFWSVLFGHLLRPQALTSVDMAEELPDGINVSLETDAMKERLRPLPFDVLLSFVDESLTRAFAGFARYGGWFFSHPSADGGPGQPVGFWERYRNVPVTQAALCHVAEQRGACQTLVQGTFPIVPHSYAATVNTFLFEMARWPEQVCRRLLAGNDLPVRTDRPGFTETQPKAPNALQTLVFLVSLFGSLLALLYRSFFRHGRWMIGVVEKPIQTVLDGKPLSDVRWLDELSEDRFAADPFALVRSEDLTILYEEFPYTTWKGRISATRLREGKRLDPSEVVFDFPFHTSYPYLFEHEGAIHCVPETWHANEVALYRAVEFPHRWVRQATLLEGIDGCDSTLLKYQGRWWLFCTYHHEGSNLKLFIWHAPDLLGPWQPHAENPVKIDVTSSRPAGTPFLHEGVLYRPAQDCSRSYGGRIVINRVTRLTPTEFTEESAFVLEPPAGRCTAGLHTIAAAGPFTVIDGLRYEFNLTAFKTILARRFRRLLGGTRRTKDVGQRPQSVSKKETVASTAS